MLLPLAAALDLASIAVFAAVGRASHTESGGVVGVLETAWPFAAGWAVGAVVGRFWRRPESLPTGAVVWITTVAGGMLLRAASGAGVQTSFVVVAATVLAILLLGWRAVTALVTRRRARASV